MILPGSKRDLERKYLKLLRACRRTLYDYSRGGGFWARLAADYKIHESIQESHAIIKYLNQKYR